MQTMASEVPEMARGASLANTFFTSSFVSRARNTPFAVNKHSFVESWSDRSVNVMMGRDGSVGGGGWGVVGRGSGIVGCGGAA